MHSTECFSVTFTSCFPLMKPWRAPCIQIFSFFAEIIIFHWLIYYIYMQNICVVFQIKSNHFYCHITTAQVPWWVKFLWACSRQRKKNNNNLHMDRQCKKNNKQFTYGQTVQKNCTGAFTVLQTVQKKKKNLHMDSTYLQTVQKTMCKIHIHILSTHSVL